MSDIKSETLEELQARCRGWGQPSYRARQVLEWLYARRATDWDAMTNIPRSLRDLLRAEYALAVLKLVRLQGAEDTTRKFLWRLEDGALIESVLIPANPALYGEPSDRHTLCVSTQVGCAYGCKFCASGLGGWKRNLGPEEIVEQVLAVERWHHARETRSRLNLPSTEDRVVSNLVIMGMGEPLANYGNLLKALRILNAPWGAGSARAKLPFRPVASHPKFANWPKNRCSSG